jgi:hypothetical protein
MLRWFKEVDRILRGEATRVSAIRDGDIKIPALGVALVGIILGLIYGFFMGWFALINRETPVYDQLLATMLKVPALFILTLVVTFPSLYVFNALVGSRLTVASVFRLLMAALAVTLAVLASFGPITAFFSISTESYSFMVLLNVVLFAVAGVLGLAFLLRTLHRLSVSMSGTEGAPPAPDSGPEGAGSTDPAEKQTSERMALPGALDEIEGHVLGPHVKVVFRCWVVIFALVGVQMSWVLRPFVGDPSLPFEWFRQRQSNFFEALWHAVESLFS